MILSANFPYKGHISFFISSNFNRKVTPKNLSTQIIKIEMKQKVSSDKKISSFFLFGDTAIIL
jgi:hypothetical protein